jgi:hypothetical protein
MPNAWDGYTHRTDWEVHNEAGFPFLACNDEAVGLVCAARGSVHRRYFHDHAGYVHHDRDSRSDGKMGDHTLLAIHLRESERELRFVPWEELIHDTKTELRSENTVDCGRQMKPSHVLDTRMENLCSLRLHASESVFPYANCWVHEGRPHLETQADDHILMTSFSLSRNLKANLDASRPSMNPSLQYPHGFVRSAASSIAL